MSTHSTSHFSRESVVSESVPAAPFTQGNHNAFPKYADALPETAWELWYFDGVSERDHSAVVVSMTRSAECREKGGFKLQLLAICPDKSTWSRDFFFPESTITTGGETEGVLGVWKDNSDNSIVSFHVTPDSSIASLAFNVVGAVTGSMNLTALPGDSGLHTRADLGPSVYYVRPIGRASVTADLTFASGQSLVWKSDDTHRVHGGFDRVWSPYVWPQIMTESYYLRAQIGPYAMQVMRIFSEMASGNKPYTVARLYHDGKLVCAPQQIIADLEDNEEVSEDSLVLEKTFGDGLTGKFRDKCHGYALKFVQGGAAGKRWAFQVLHEAPIWNMPTSAPGINGTGNTGFVESVSGGAKGETFQGVAVGGQCELKH